MDAKGGVGLLQLWIMVVLLILMVGTGITALYVEDLLASVILFGALSFFAVLLYLVLNAPDVAFTEAVIGIVATAFFIAALKRMGRWASR